MLLRSVSRHVKDQNWTAIAIDFVIVVIGVYVGIEVSNWNERRAEAQRAQEYLERIEADLVYNLDGLENRKVFWNTVSAQGELALAYAERGELAGNSAWTTLRAFFDASQIWRFSFNDTTYAEMLNSGDLSLIESSELRSAFAEYFVVRAPRRGEGIYLLQPAYRQTVRSAFPAELARYYWKECYRQERDFQALQECDAPIEGAEATALLQELTNVPGLLSELRFWMDTQELFLRLAEVDIDMTKELIDQTVSIRD